MSKQLATMLCTRCRHPIATMSLTDDVLVETGQAVASMDAVDIPAQAPAPMRSRRVVHMRLTHLNREIVL